MTTSRQPAARTKLRPLPIKLARLWGLRQIYGSLARAANVPYLPAVCLFLLVSASVLMVELRKLLRAMHPVGGGAYGVADLSHVFSGNPPPHDVYLTWQAWNAQAAHQPHPHPQWIASWWLGLDTLVLVPSYTLLFAVMLVRASRRLQEPTPGQSRFGRRARPLSAVVQNGAVYKRLIRIAFALVPVLAVVDWIENGLLASLVGGTNSQVDAIAVRVATGLKELLFVLILLPAVAVWLALAWRSRRGLLAVESHPDWLDELRLLRKTAFVVGAFGLLMLGPYPLGEQTRDVIRRMGDHLAASLLAFALILAFAAVVAGSSRILLSAAHTEPVQPTGGTLPSILAVAVSSVLLLVLVLLSLTGHHPPIGLYAPLGIVLVVALLNLGIGDTERHAPEPPPKPTFVWRLLAAAPLALFGIAALGATSGDVFYTGGARPIVLLFVGLAFLIAAGGVYVLLGRLEERQSGDLRTLQASWVRRLWVLIAIGILLAVAMFFGTVFDEAQTAQWAGGTIGVIAGFMLLATVVTFGLGWAGEKLPMPSAFAILRFRRIPIIGLVALWLVIASAIDRTGYHVIRTLPSATSPAGASLTLEAAFNRWLAEDPPRIRAATGRPIRPLVFVTAEGGGIRAGYWAALVLACLVDGQQQCADNRLNGLDARSLFALSGVSGGALGLVEYAAERGQPDSSSAANWVAARLGGDYLGPTFAHMLFIDAPNAFLRARYWHDRAGSLEGAWERSWAHGQLTTGFFHRGATFPLLLLNGTSVTDGCRFETSILMLSVETQTKGVASSCRTLAMFERAQTAGIPGHLPEYVPPSGRKDWALAATKDVQSFLCPTSDIRLSTAALLAARFPIITPSGRVGCRGGNPAYVVDGGYFENSGVATVDETWSALQPLVAKENARPGAPCVVPFLIEIDNHYGDPAGPGPQARPSELTVPLQTLSQVRNGHESDARAEGALLFSGSIAPGQRVESAQGLLDRAAYIHPFAHPGTQAPLGWTMSSVAVKDLADQLQTPAVRNQLRNVNEWFTPGTLTCSIKSG